MFRVMPMLLVDKVYLPKQHQKIGLCNCNSDNLSWKLMSYIYMKFVFLSGLISMFAILQKAAIILFIQVSQEEWTKLRESVPYVKIYRYNPKHLYPKLNSYGDNVHRKVWASGGSTFYTPSVTPYSSTAHARQRDIVMQ